MGRHRTAGASPHPGIVLSVLALVLLGALGHSAPAHGATSYKMLYAFPQVAAGPPPEGVTPSGLLQGLDGNFYGTTYYGGANDFGSVFKLTLTPSPTLTTLYSFTAQTDGTSPAPSAGLIQDSDGNFYGTTYKGGPDDLGTVFQLSPTGTLTTLHAFTVAGADGQSPLGGLVRDSSTGTLYGTTSEGGDWGLGTVFQLVPTTGGFTLTTLHQFSGTEGPPAAGLLREATTGTLYGTTQGDGASNAGTVFQLTPAGETFTVTTLYTFTCPDGACPHGANPAGPLLQGPAGILYGATTYGGAGSCGEPPTGCGTLFQLTVAPTPSLVTLQSFTGPDGAYPAGPLLRDPDGTLYGTTAAGTGVALAGTLFRWTPLPTPTLTPLHLFTGTDGAAPQAGLTRGTDGYFYGMTSQGGATGKSGVAFVLRVGNALTVTPAGTGSGTVTSTPPGLTCPDTCTAVFLPTATVTLTAAAAQSSTFTGWSGTSVTCPGTGACPVSPEQAPAVTATFTLKTFALTLHKGGTGTGTVTSTPTGITCGTACSVNFNYNTVVTLTATATAPAVFTGWSGAGCSGTGTCVVTLTAAQTVTATFDPPSAPLTVMVGGSSGGTVSTSLPGITNCSAACTATFPTNTPITLTLTPGASGTFREWRGACTGSGACVVTLSAAQTVTAVFAKTFTDATLSGVAIKAVHFTELREAVNALRSHRTPALPAFAWTDAAPAPGGVVRRSHLTDLRTALDQAYTATPGKSHGAYTDPDVTTSTLIKAAHLTQLRGFVHDLE